MFCPNDAKDIQLQLALINYKNMILPQHQRRRGGGLLGHLRGAHLARAPSAIPLEGESCMGLGEKNKNNLHYVIFSVIGPLFCLCGQQSVCKENSSAGGHALGSASDRPRSMMYFLTQ